MTNYSLIDQNFAIDQALGIYNPRCVNISGQIRSNDTCPGICYHSLEDDPKIWYTLSLVLIVVIYNIGYFLLKRTTEKVFHHEVHQWAAAMLQGRPKDTKQTVTAIQTMRNSLQGSQLFSAAAGAIAAYGLLVNDSNRHDRNLFFVLSLVNWFSVYCFAEQMRYINHLSYLVIKTRPLSQAQIPSEFLHYLREVMDSGEDFPVYKDSGDMYKYMVDERIAPFMDGDSLESYYLNLETFLPPEAEIERVVELLSRSFTYFSLGVRSFLAGFPFYFGFVDDSYMLIGVILLILFHVFYYDDLLDRQGFSSGGSALARYFLCCCRRTDDVDHSNTPLSEEEGKGKEPGTLRKFIGCFGLWSRFRRQTPQAPPPSDGEAVVKVEAAGSKKHY
jgi:hypothetical protein